MKFRKIFTLFTLAPIAGYSTLLQVPEQYGTIQSAISASIDAKITKPINTNNSCTAVPQHRHHAFYAIVIYAVVRYFSVFRICLIYPTS